MSSLKPIVLHGHPGPNPWKVTILLDELDIPYKTTIYTTAQLKEPSFLELNRNGMSPVIQDPNTDLLLAESGAIMDYVVEQYDKEHRISFTDLKENYLMRQWLQFQTTTQGPMIQQVFHWGGPPFASNPEAHAAYVKDVRHVFKVLNNELADKQWLVGDKCSAADLSYVSFHTRLDAIMRGDKPDMEKEFPKLDAWIKRMLERASVQKMLGDRDAALKLAFKK